MSRKSIARRATIEQATQMLIDHGDNSAPRSNPDSEARRAVDPERTARLLNYTPRLDPKSVETIRDVAVDLVLRIKATTLPTDRFTASTLFHYAIYCLERHGRFDPVEHLGEQYIRPYSTRYLNSASQASIVSALRRVRSGGVAPPKQSRSKVAHPYSRDEWADLLHAARQWPTEEATLLLTLSGLMGLRSPEIKNARVDWVNIDLGDRVTMTVVDSDGTFRVVPAFDQTASVIRAAVERSDEYLFSRHLVNRNNAVNRLIRRLATEFKVFEKFSVARARNTYISRLLQAGLPFALVCTVCGIKPGVQLPTDLLPWMTAFTDEQIYQDFSDMLPEVLR